MKNADLLAALQQILKSSNGRIRVKIRLDKEPTEWSNWVINPAKNYFEVEHYGPFLLRDAEWFEVRPPLDINQILHNANFPRLQLNDDGDALRIYHW